jgi:hypothetical protein
MKRYCKHCGEVVYPEENIGEIIHCYNCDTPITLKDTIAGHTRDARINQLKAMHDLMCEANDEGIYMTWIYLMPDCPSEEDFESIAIDDEQYNECFDLFVKLIAKNGNRY